MSYSEIKQQINILHDKIPSFLGRNKVIKKQLLALDQLAEIGKPFDAKYIVNYINSKEKVIAKKTAEVIRILLTKNTNYKIWIKIYENFFSYWRHYDLFSKTTTLKSLDDCQPQKIEYVYGVANLNDFYDNLAHETNLKYLRDFQSPEIEHIYGIASLNSNGYIREEALDCLEKSFNPEALPYIILRLNDWVPEVQQKATQVFIKYLQSISVYDLIKYSGLIDWLTKLARVDLKYINNEIYNKINNYPDTEQILRNIKSLYFKQRLFYYKIIINKLLNSDLINYVISDPSPEIKTWIIQYLIDNEHLKYKLNNLYEDKSSKVRYKVIQAIKDLEFSQYTDWYFAAIFDDAKKIREYARFVIKSNQEVNFTEIYREKFLELQPRFTPGVICGLGETGITQDIELIKPLINNKISKIRAAAYYSISLLGHKDLNMFVQGLQDSNNKVRNISVFALKLYRLDVQKKVEFILKNNSNLKSKKSALILLKEYGKLDALKNILQALTLENEELKSFAWSLLNSWYEFYNVRLWILNDCDKNSYQEITALLDIINRSDIKIPFELLHTWSELQKILKTLKLKEFILKH